MPKRKLPVTDARTSESRTLATLLAERGTLTVAAALAQVRNLAQQVGELHAAGMIHGAIDPAVIPLDDFDVPQLPMPAPGTILRLDDDWASLLPGFSRLPPINLPEAIATLRHPLEQAGITIDPRQIDVCQLGDIMCRLLTGESAGDYLRSPRVKGLVPTGLRPLMERMLGANGDERFPNTQEFLVALTIAAEQVAPPSGKRNGDARPVDAASTIAPDPPLPFTTLGHYEIVRCIGQG
ncbi:MAG TPA: hypothetical protein VGH74_11775, partial [Planctomycetaceae bacterium]